MGQMYLYIIFTNLFLQKLFSQVNSIARCKNKLELIQKLRANPPEFFVFTRFYFITLNLKTAKIGNFGHQNLIVPICVRLSFYF